MAHRKTEQTTIIAVCGKGGVGKTSISAAIARILAESGHKKVLAVDADPAVGLATALGFQVGTTIDNIRNELIERLESGSSGDKKETISLLDYQVLDALAERDNLAFLAIGRPENKGCYCKINVVLKDVIETVARGFDYVVIDGEAGIEQVNRRVMERVSHLILVSDASAKGISVAATIKNVAKRAMKAERTGLIINRLRDESERDRIKIPEAVELLGWIPEDEALRQLDIEGRSIMELGNDGFMAATRTLLKQALTK